MQHHQPGGPFKSTTERGWPPSGSTTPGHLLDALGVCGGLANRDHHRAVHAERSRSSLLLVWWTATTACRYAANCCCAGRLFGFADCRAPRWCRLPAALPLFCSDSACSAPRGTPTKGCRHGLSRKAEVSDGSQVSHDQYGRVRLHRCPIAGWKNICDPKGRRRKAAAAPPQCAERVGLLRKAVIVELTQLGGRAAN